MDRESARRLGRLRGEGGGEGDAGLETDGRAGEERLIQDKSAAFPNTPTTTLPTDRRSSARTDNRKRKRLPGEDDTDRDIRLARSATDPNSALLHQVARLRPSRPDERDAPITDCSGNINLFPELRGKASSAQSGAGGRGRGRDSRRTEQEKELERVRVMAESCSMHMRDAWGHVSRVRRHGGNGNIAHGNGNGHGHPAAGPGGAWYLDPEGGIKDTRTDKEVWGDEDPRRVLRERARVVATDPLAAMKQAQSRLKAVKREREERDREIERMRRVQGDVGLGALDDVFSLDVMSRGTRSRSRDRLGHHRERDRDRHRGKRSREGDCDKKRNRELRHDRKRRLFARSPSPRG